MNSVYATVIISEWPVCEPAPVGGARLLSWPLVACRGALVAGGPAGGGRGPGETLARSAPYPARLQLGLCWLPATPLDAGFCCAGQGARHQRPRRGASKKRRQQKTPRPGAEKKSPPLLVCFWSPSQTENNSQLSGCDFNILCQDPGSIPAPHTTFRKNSKN